MSEPMDYASAGVDIDLEGSAVASLIGALSKSVRTPVRRVLRWTYREASAD